jgi:hypothetical protein
VPEVKFLLKFTQGIDICVFGESGSHCSPASKKVFPHAEIFLKHWLSLKIQVPLQLKFPPS